MGRNIKMFTINPVFAHIKVFGHFNIYQINDFFGRFLPKPPRKHT